MNQSEYVSSIKRATLLRLPLKGEIDLTYRCNNNCRHCWLAISASSPQKEDELRFDEIVRIVDEARAFGCREWNISGGEPMLRPDFLELFEYITKKSISYSLNTNGTLITPDIAGLMKRKGRKLISIYGADEKVHDHITRVQGSFDAMMKGISYLKDTGAGFFIQIVPLKDNFHQMDEMIRFAEKWSGRYRLGASWLYLSKNDDPSKNREILKQRLGPDQIVKLNPPNVFDTETDNDCTSKNDDGLYANCISVKQSFHIDPYGSMSFCAFVKDPALRYLLKKGSFSECWNQFIPSLKNAVIENHEYETHCKGCRLRGHCKWCPVYGFLEEGRHTAKVPYLCDIATEGEKYRSDWEKHHRRYYQIAGLTIQVDSELPITDETFHPKFEKFRIDTPGNDIIRIRHYFTIPEQEPGYGGKELYRKPPWAIYKKNNIFLYLGISSMENNDNLHQMAVISSDHTDARIYSRFFANKFKTGQFASLTLFPTDQILLSRVIADRDGCFFHSAGVVISGSGFLFAGHSDAGKSTMTTMLQKSGEILCDDRIIIRKWNDGFKIHGTWNHGDIPDVSPSEAPLKAIFFLSQSDRNRITLIENKTAILHKILECLIKPLETGDWWQKMLTLAEMIVKEIPCYTLEFDKSGNVVDLIEEMAGK